MPVRNARMVYCGEIRLGIHIAKKARENMGWPVLSHSKVVIPAIVIKRTRK
jgi:hypothetical protein